MSSLCNNTEQIEVQNIHLWHVGQLRLKGIELLSIHKRKDVPLVECKITPETHQLQTAESSSKQELDSLDHAE